MKIAFAQLNPTIGDLFGNVNKILQVAIESSDRGVQLLLTPELSLCGYPPRDLLMDQSFIRDIAEAATYLAQQLPRSLAVLVGSVTNHQDQAGGKPLHNSALLLQDGCIQQIFTKQLLPTYDVFDEDRYFRPGRGHNIWQLSLENRVIRIGVTICEDIWNDERFWGMRQYSYDPVAELMASGIDLLVNLSASPYAVDKHKLREEMLLHSVKHYCIPVIYLNQVGGNDDLIFDGNSLAINRQGVIVSRAPAFREAVEFLDFDPQAQDFTTQATVLPYDPRPEAEIWQALVLGVQDYARKCNFSKAVIGLSGGIDSSLVATIAASALGSQNVLGVLMPSPYSSHHSLQDAYALARNLGISTHLLPISTLMDSYDRLLGELFAGTTPGITEENLQSRIRGNLLMAIANKFGHLLLSTGNKSEMAVGYCTLYGDMNGGLAVIADLPKTLVYRLCYWLNDRQECPLENLPEDIQPIPENVLKKAPSAELKPNQTDQDSLPPYEVLDDILHHLIDRHASQETILALGHPPEVVHRVIMLVQKAEFKRRQAPPGLKISDRAFGSGWRMPIASKRSSLRQHS